MNDLSSFFAAIGQAIKNYGLAPTAGGDGGTEHLARVSSSPLARGAS